MSKLADAAAKLKEIVADVIDTKKVYKKFVETVLVPKVQALKVKIAKGEIDIIKGTDLDAKLMMKACDIVIANLLKEVSEEAEVPAEDAGA